VDFLSRQKDCHVFLTHNSYLESGFGRDWQQTILDRYSENHWWLIIDADEIFTYPASETISLPQLCHYLDSIGAQAVSAMMLDLYSKEPISEAAYSPGQPFTDVCNYFDSEYSFWPRPRHMKLYKKTGHSIWKLKHDRAPLLFPAMEPIGGPRIREFYPQYHKPGLFTVFKMKLMRQIGKILTALEIKLKGAMLMPSVLFKVPLVKGGCGARLIDSHSVANVELAPITGALLHFKFFADFHKRVVEAMHRGEHFDSASEYALYLAGLEKNPLLSFYYEKSVKYENSRQLSNLNFIKDDLSYVNYRRTQSYDTALHAIESLLDEEQAAEPGSATKNDLSS